MFFAIEYNKEKCILIFCVLRTKVDKKLKDLSITRKDTCTCGIIVLVPKRRFRIRAPRARMRVHDSWPWMKPICVRVITGDTRRLFTFPIGKKRGWVCDGAANGGRAVEGIVNMKGGAFRNHHVDSAAFEEAIAPYRTVRIVRRAACGACTFIDTRAFSRARCWLPTTNITYEH